MLIAVEGPRVLDRGLRKNHALAWGLDDFARAGAVLTSFPRAMLIMAATFGLWRARADLERDLRDGVAAVMLVLLGGTTWLISCSLI